MEGWSVQSLAPRPPMRSLPNGVGPSCATLLPGSNAATGPIAGVTGLSVTSETGTLSPPIRTQSCATRTQPAGGMRRATLAGSAGIQIARRTARTPWEHGPGQVLRDDAEPSLPRREKHQFAEQRGEVASEANRFCLKPLPG